MTKKESAFVNTVQRFYKEHGRHTLPWRKTHNPYRILVSEIMLQQTQVDRVLPKYQSFLKTFPTVQVLADASLAEVLRMWQGLGYNRRAQMLHQCAKDIVTHYNGKFPRTYEELTGLPGVGPYTARAILAFAFNLPGALIETNVRTVYLHHFFKDHTDVSDAQLLQYIERTLDTKNPREWYWALMDYGAHIKKTHGNPNSRSAQYTKQSSFQGSDRQIRGAIVRALTHKPYTRTALISTLSQFEDIRIDAQLEKLLSEAMVTKKGKTYSLPH